MTSVPIRRLRETIAETVRRASSGHSTIVTVNGKPVAEVGPVGRANVVGSTQALIAQGLLAPPSNPRPWKPTDPVTIWPGTRIDRLLREIR